MMPSAVAAAKVARRTPAQRRNQIDQPERKDRHQPQEQQIAEGVGAKALRQLLRQRPRPAHEMLAERALGDQKDADRADRRAHQRRRPAEDGAEQDSADHREIEPDRHRQRDHHDIERDIGRHRGHLVPRDEVPQGLVVAGQRLERQLPVPAHGDDHARHDHDHDQRTRARRSENFALSGATAEGDGSSLGGHDDPGAWSARASRRS